MIVDVEYLGLLTGVALNVDDVSRKSVSNVQRYSPASIELFHSVVPKNKKSAYRTTEVTPVLNSPVDVDVISLAQVWLVEVTVTIVGNERK